MAHILVFVEIKDINNLERAMERHMRYAHPRVFRGDGWENEHLSASFLVLKDGSSVNAATVGDVDVAATRALFESRTVFDPEDNVCAPDIVTVNGDWHGYHDGYTPDLTAWALIEKMGSANNLVVVDVHE
jgi:hypothetical protein